MNKQSSTTLDLSKGPILSLMIRFCLPILLGNIMQQFYNAVDAAVVGHYVGTTALAAVGATGSLTFLVLGFVNGASAGFCIPLSQAFGAGNESLMKRIVWNMIYISAALSVILAAVTTLLLRQTLILMDFPSDIINDSLIYLRVIFLGIPATMAYNVMAGLMRSMGNSKAPLVILVAASLTNVVLDLLFIRVFNLGVLGAASATIISQICSAVACFIYIVKSYPIFSVKNTSKAERKLDTVVSAKLLASGLPMALQFSITAIGSILIQKAVNGFGTTTVAAVSAAYKVQAILILFYDTIGVTVSTWCGQNIGAKNYDRIKKGVLTALGLAAAYSVVMGLIGCFLGDTISLIFIDKTEENLDTLLEIIRVFLKTNCSFYLALATLNVFRYALQGLGYGFTAMFAGIFEMIARSLVALVAVDIFGFTAICYANPMAWIAACLLLIPACLVVFPRIRKKLTSTKE